MKLPESEREVAEEFLPSFRKLRQDIVGILTVVNLRDLAAEAFELKQEFSVKHREIVLNKLMTEKFKKYFVHDYELNKDKIRYYKDDLLALFPSDHFGISCNFNL